MINTARRVQDFSTNSATRLSLKLKMYSDTHALLHVYAYQYVIIQVCSAAIY